MSLCGYCKFSVPCAAGMPATIALLSERTFVIYFFPQFVVVAVYVARMSLDGVLQQQSASACTQAWPGRTVSRLTLPAMTMHGSARRAREALTRIRITF